MFSKERVGEKTFENDRRQYQRAVPFEISVTAGTLKTLPSRFIILSNPPGKWLLSGENKFFYSTLKAAGRHLFYRPKTRRETSY